VRPLGRLYVSASMVPHIWTLLSFRRVLDVTGEVCLRLAVVDRVGNMCRCG
jgi:hypothetical protein